MTPNKPSECPHTKLVFGPSSHAVEAGYDRPNLTQRIAATTPQGSVKGIAAKFSTTKEKEQSSTFPAPLILPGDDLALDPTYPPQSLNSWTREKDRNSVTPKRRTVYLVAPPGLDPALEFAQKWTHPRLRASAKEKSVDFPNIKDVLGYLAAFYHGLPVKMLPQPNPCFTADIEEDIIEPQTQTKGKKGVTKAAQTKSPTLWLNTHTASGCIGIRSRATPKGHFSHQVNLNDLLDAAIEILPDDAYALIMLIEHDMFEDDDDEFVCGRAYGGSRVAVVSGARYNPILDRPQGLERDHAWPASHCAAYVQDCCKEVIDVDEYYASQEREKAGNKITTTEQLFTDETLTPMHAALAAHASLPSLEYAPSIAALEGLWLGRLCRTASHELGHCFGIDHCVYYSCAMQGTASVIEDARQPPYLCPVDLAKVLKATGANEQDRYRSLLAFCERYKDVHLFASYKAWMTQRLGDHSS